MPIPEAQPLDIIMHRIATAPNPEDLASLQGLLLSLGISRETQPEPLLELVKSFYDYLTELRGKLRGRAFSEMASLLDLAAMGAVALEGMDLSAGLGKLLMGSLGEGLAVLGSRQYIKGWNVEISVLHEKASWVLRDALWSFSATNRPDLPAPRRLALVESLLMPIQAVQNRREPDSQVLATLYLACLFQILILARLQKLQRRFE